MASELPNVGADIILEFQQSITNIQQFGQAMEVLDNKFGTLETRINNLKNSMNGLKQPTSKGSANNLRQQITNELNNAIQRNGVVIGNVGKGGFNVKASTLNSVFKKVERELNLKLAEAYKNINLSISPNLQVGKVPITKDDFNEVNRAIGRLVKVQLNNLVTALRKHGGNMIGAEDLAGIQFSIGKSTVQQIINKIKTHIQRTMLNPEIGEAQFRMSDNDFNRVFTAIKNKVKDSLDTAVAKINGGTPGTVLPNNMQEVYNAINKEVRQYVTSVTSGINTLSASSMTKPLSQVSKQLQRSMADSLGMKLTDFQRDFKDHKFTNADLSTADLRRQFQRLEQALNKKIGGSLAEEVKAMVNDINAVQVSYSPKLRRHLIQEIGKINNSIVKKIREQIDLQFTSMRAEINSVQVAPKDINRARRVRDMGRVNYDDMDTRRRSSSQDSKPLVNDPYGRRDNHYNGFGLEGAITNTFRHILAGSMVGAPMMLLYQSFEQFRTSQLEQLKMFSNLFAKATAETPQRAAEGDTRTATQVANDTIKNIMPFVKDTAQLYAIDYGRMSQVASVGSRLLNTDTEVKTFTDVVAKIYNIDREGDPATSIAPGMEAFMGQFGLMVHELEQKVAIPLAVATNVTNATTEDILNAVMRSGASFNSAGVTPEQAIAMIAATRQGTGLSGENVGNFYKSVLPRLQSPTALKQLDSIGVKVYEDSPNGVNGTKKARSGKDILDEVSKQYERLDDAESRKIIMSLFGTYQSSKGTTTLMEFEEIRDIMKAIEGFKPEDFSALLQATTQSPVMEMERAGVSMNLALVDVLEELTPEITEISKGLTDLSSGIREHKEALAGFITFLGNSLLGFATMYGMRRLGGAAGVSNSIARTQTIDTLAGNRGVFGKGATQGTLMANFGSYARQGVLENNRAAVNRAMNNPVTAPVMQYLATMNREQVSQMQAYMKDNNIKAKSFTDLALIAEESKNYRQRAPLTPDERWGGSMQNSKNLYRKGMMGLDENFATMLSSDMQDRKKFDELGKTKQGKKITNFLGGLDENGLRSFQNHLEDIHRTTGKTVNSVGSMTHAINTYTGAQARQREEIRRSNPHLNELSRNMNRVVGSLNSSEMTRGVRNMDTFLGSISTKARGATSAFGGLARTVGGFAAQLAIMAGLGWTIGSVTDATKPRTEDEKIVKRGEKQLQDIDAYRDYAMKGLGGQIATGFWSKVKGFGDFFVFWEDAWTDMGDMRDVQKEFIKFLEDSKGMEKWTNASDGRNEIRVRDFMNKYSKEEQDKIWQEFKTGEGTEKVVEEANTRLFQAELQRRAKESQEQAALAEGVSLKEAERRRKDLLKGSYRDYDLDSVKQDIQDRVGELTTEYTLQQIQAIEDGYASDSPEFMAIRQGMSKKIIELYQEQLNFIAQTVEDLTKNLETAKANGASEDEIKQIEDDLNRWKANQEKAGGELEIMQDDVKKQQQEDDFNAAMSRINRSSQSAETALSIKDSINQATMDRNSGEYVDASMANAKDRINNLTTQIEQLKGVATTPDQQQQINAQIEQLQSSIEQERVRIRDLKLSKIGLYKQDLSDSLEQLSNEYLQARVDSGGADEDSPQLRNLRINQYDRQTDIFGQLIKDRENDLKATNDPEAQKAIQREIRDLQRQSLQAQLGILDEMKSEGATFNLPDNVKAMSYYEYMTRDNTHQTYTVQGGDTNVTVTLPNITDGTSADRIKQIGKAFGEGLHEGNNLRLQKQANPFGYRGGML